MNDMESSESAELDADHRDAGPSLGAGFCGFVVTHEAAVEHQPAEGSFYDPTARQNLEPFGVVGALDDFDRQLGAQSLDPLGKGFADIAAPWKLVNPKPTGKMKSSREYVFNAN